MPKRYRIQFPPSDSEKLGQDEVFFILIEDGEEKRLRFHNAMKLFRTDGWLAFKIKETFLDHTEHTGVSRLVRELIFSKYLDIYHLFTDTAFRWRDRSCSTMPW